MMIRFIKLVLFSFVCSTESSEILSILNKNKNISMYGDFSIDKWVFYINHQSLLLSNMSNMSINDNYYIWYAMLEQNLFSLEEKFFISFKIDKFIDNIRPVTEEKEYSIRDILSYHPLSLFYSSGKLMAIFYVAKTKDAFIITFEEKKTFKEIKKKESIIEKKEEYKYKVLSLKTFHSNEVNKIIDIIKEKKIGSYLTKEQRDCIERVSIINNINSTHKEYFFLSYTPHYYGDCKKIKDNIINKPVNLFVVHIDKNNYITNIIYKSHCCPTYK